MLQAFSALSCGWRCQKAELTRQVCFGEDNLHSIWHTAYATTACPPQPAYCFRLSILLTACIIAPEVTAKRMTVMADKRHAAHSSLQIISSWTL